MKLPLARLGWSMPSSFAMVSDLGVERSLTLTPPSLLQVFLKEGVWRSLEREAAAKYGLEGAESLCFDVVIKALRSKSLLLARKEPS
eukprot:8212455-Pyramimonas_sp.AAC.1